MPSTTATPGPVVSADTTARLWAMHQAARTARTAAIRAELAHPQERAS